MNYDLQCSTLMECMLEIGGKGRALKIVQGVGRRIPETWIIPAEEFDKVLRELAGMESLEDFMKGSTYDPEILPYFESQLRINRFDISFPDERFTDSTDLIVRSSSVSNSQGGNNYAEVISGAYESVRAKQDGLLEAVFNVWLSSFTEKAFLQNRLLPADLRTKSMAVLIQPYVPASISGLFHVGTEDPGSQIMQLAWIEGNLEPLVSGRQYGNQISVHEMQDGFGVALIGQEESIRACQQLPSLAVFEALAEEAGAIKRAFNTALEVEWAFDGKQVWILQVQALTL